ncbi:RE1-silencing transcription factor-like isoform X2 [Sitophilus oryzae]|uniref:RE1-silencing transcription factor-like isoform X2 n=1 Tax=Sitophilus oryzae TaxID=7048 RepID=A0A6J2YW51_SITOR|nr:RE1-silencing transcription factor-like isoform X2 [Sitophilus oryzae]
MAKMHCFNCRRTTEHSFSVFNEWGETHTRIRDYIEETVGKEKLDLLFQQQPESQICNMCLRLIEGCTKVKRQLAEAISSGREQQPPGDYASSMCNVDEEIVSFLREGKKGKRKGRAQSARGEQESRAALRSVLSENDKHSRTPKRRKKMPTFKCDEYGNFESVTTRSCSRMPEEFYCYACERYEYDLTSYTSHMIVSHGYLALYSCRLCNTYYVKQSHLKMHEQIHDNEFPLCPICGTRQENLKEFHKHIDEHMLYSVPCPHCDLSFQTKREWKNHKSMKHQDTRTRIKDRKIYRVQEQYVYSIDISDESPEKNIYSIDISDESPEKKYCAKVYDASVYQQKSRFHTKTKLDISISGGGTQVKLAGKPTGLGDDMINNIEEIEEQSMVYGATVYRKKSPFRTKKLDISIKGVHMEVDFPVGKPTGLGDDMNSDSEETESNSRIPTDNNTLDSSSSDSEIESNYRRPLRSKKLKKRSSSLSSQESGNIDDFHTKERNLASSLNGILEENGYRVSESSSRPPSSIYEESKHEKSHAENLDTSRVSESSLQTSSPKSQEHEHENSDTENLDNSQVSESSLRTYSPKFQKYEHENTDSEYLDNSRVPESSLRTYSPKSQEHEHENSDTENLDNSQMSQSSFQTSSSISQEKAPENWENFNSSIELQSPLRTDSPTF